MISKNNLNISSFSDLLETVPCRYGLITYFKSNQIIGRSLREYGEWAQYEIELLLNFVREGDVVIDVGAFIGTHTLAFARHVGKTGLVYAFEPNPLAYEVLNINVQKNSASNVKLFNVALSNVKGVIYLDVIPSGLENQPGSFSLAGVKESIENEQRSAGIAIKVARLDDFELTSCHLIKIDVEGMESKVLEGAHSVLRRFRPLVYAECLSVENGVQMVSIMKDEKYRAFIHCVSAYNPDNFRKNSNNFFGGARETNILFIPSERLLECHMRSSKFQELIPLETADDLVLALLQKPQYKYEILSKTFAASVIGYEFWANEPELKQLRSQLAEKEQTVCQLQTQLAEKEQTVRQLQTQLAEQEALITKLQQRLSWRRYRFADSVMAFIWWARHPELAYHVMKTWVRKLGKKGLPVYNKRVNTARDDELRKRRQTSDFHESELVFNVDALTIKRNRLFGWGWLFHKRRPIKDLKLLVKTKGCRYDIPCQYGLTREDVANKYNFPNARNSGFIMNGKLPAYVTPVQFFLEIYFADGDKYCLDISTAVSKLKIRPRTRTLTSQIKKFINITLKYFSQGDLKGWFRVILNKFYAYIKSFRLQKTINLDRLSCIADQSPAHRVYLIIDHNLGGGANLYRRRLVWEKKRSGPVLLIFYDLPSLWYRLHCFYRDNEQCFQINSLKSLTTLIKRVHVEEIFLNNLVSFDEPLMMVQWCLDLKYQTGARLTIPIHDYFCICPSYTLLNNQGKFCGVPSFDRCQECLSNHKGEFRTLVDYNDIRTWRFFWGNLLKAADCILCFSYSSIDLLKRAYPDLDPSKIVVQPHYVEPFRKVSIKLKPKLHIGIVGNIHSESKGANIVRQMVEIIEKECLPIHITVFGMMKDPPISSVLKVTGLYKREELPDLIERSEANVFFLPSICPETFSFVTAELIQMGVPLAVFDLGAQAEHVKKYPLGLVISKIDAAYALKALFDFYNQLCNQLKDP